MTGTWAVIQMTQLEDGNGQLAEGFILAHSLDGEVHARAVVREAGAEGEVYAIVDLEGPLFRLCAGRRIERVNTRGDAV